MLPKVAILLFGVSLTTSKVFTSVYECEWKFYLPEYMCYNVERIIKVELTIKVQNKFYWILASDMKSTPHNIYRLTAYI